MNIRKLFTSCALGLALTATTAQEARAVDIVINYLDAPGYGFNDPLLGASRRQAFELAMWGMSATLSSQVPISVDTYFAYGLGTAWGYDDGYPYRFWRDFSGGYPGIYYPSALRNKLYGDDGLPGESDVLVVFNGDIDDLGGRSGERFYYGLDGNPGNNVDFVTISFHAFLRGMGFYTLLNPANGEYYLLDGDTMTYPDILSAHLVQTKKSFLDKKAKLMIDLPPKKRKKALSSKNKLKWWGFNLTNAAGGLVPMYAPKVKKKDPIPYGVADHFDHSYWNRTVMSPTYDWAATHDLGGARWALVDMGWSLY